MPPDREQPKASACSLLWPAMALLFKLEREAAGTLIRTTGVRGVSTPGCLQTTCSQNHSLEGIQAPPLAYPKITEPSHSLQLEAGQ